MQKKLLAPVLYKLSANSYENDPTLCNYLKLHDFARINRTSCAFWNRTTETNHMHDPGLDMSIALLGAN